MRRPYYSLIPTLGLALVLCSAYAPQADAYTKSSTVVSASGSPLSDSAGALELILSLMNASGLNNGEDVALFVDLTNTLNSDNDAALSNFENLMDNLGLQTVDGSSTGVSGKCGAANGAEYSSAPTLYLCLNGTASSVSETSDGGYTWTCSGSDGGSTATCKTYVSSSSDAVCGSSAASCTTGTPTNVSSATDGSVTWTCTGSSGGTVQCSSASNTAGACGTANGTTISEEPTATAAKCSNGNATSFMIDTTNWTYYWYCSTSFTGDWINSSDTARCTATMASSAVPSAGVCGSANGTTVSTMPQTSTMCDVGAPSYIFGDTELSWYCIGKDSSASCTATYSGS